MRGRGRGRGGSRGGRAPSAPWSRLKPVELDPLDAIGLPSKGDNRLLDFKTQERYYTKIVERYMTFCSDAGERDELLRRFASLNLATQPPSTNKSSAHINSTPHPPSVRPHPHHAVTAPDGIPVAPSALSSNTKGLQDVLAALRKLREGIVASKRADDFAVQAYLFCIRLSVLVKHPESYHPSALHLLRHIHPLHPMTSVETSEVVAYLILDTACRRNDLAEAYAIRHQYKLKDPKIDGVLEALAHDNYVLLKRLKMGVDGHKVKLLEYAEEAMRRHTLKCFGRSYLSVDLEFLEKCTDTDWMDLISNDKVGWDLEGSKVIIRKVKAR
ncbi:putative CSN8/PSMD8/EIF3K domain-containing protein [Seiridium cardinale]|uniref:CSN8/PSMD8/EIF3K domain-containing protein n=1 Tax=Seiridium cardinale TaxID=138064 RepID=A0ABR2XTH7_9PEZI